MRNIKGVNFFSEKEVSKLMDDVQEEALADTNKNYVRQAWEEYGQEIPTILDWGLLTKDTLVHAMSHLQGLKITPKALFIEGQYLTQILSRGEFVDFFDPATKTEIMFNGRIGTLLGLEIYTDEYLNPGCRFIKGIHLRYKNEDSTQTKASSKQENQSV